MAICSEEHIREIESQFGVLLPKAYKKFLLGKYPRVERNLIGSDFGLNVLPKLKDWANELLQESGAEFELAPDHFVFLMHQGYQFNFFRCDGSDDPAVFGYMENDKQPKLSSDHFSKFIESLQ